MGKPWRDPDLGDGGCCCDKNYEFGIGPQDSIFSHGYDVETWPHPYTVDVETFGGATVDSYTLSRGAPAEFDPPGVTPPQKTGQYSMQLDLTVTAPAGRWNAWVILWIPSSSFLIEEVLDVNDPNGIVIFTGILHGMVCRMRKQSRNFSVGAFGVFSSVLEYNGTRYYTPHKYITNTQPDVFGNPIPDRPPCWRVLGGASGGQSIISSPLGYASPALTHDCSPSPTSITRVGFVVGLTTVAEDPANDRDVEGTITASLNFDNLYSYSAYSPRCLCWFDGISTLNLEIELGPAELQGQTITLTLQGDGTYTGSGTYDGGAKTYSIVYTPCGSLNFEAPDCATGEGPISVSIPHQPRTDIEDGGYYDFDDQWQPINVRYEKQVCYVGLGGTGVVPNCGLSANTTCPIGSPPFQVIHPGIIWAFRITE